MRWLFCLVQPKGIFPAFILCVLVFICLCLCLSGLGWRAAIRPADHPVANFEFDVVVGADGRRNTLEGETMAKKKSELYRCLKDALHFACEVWYKVTCLIKGGTLCDLSVYFPTNNIQRTGLEPTDTLRCTCSWKQRVLVMLNFSYKTHTMWVTSSSPGRVCRGPSLHVIAPLSPTFPGIFTKAKTPQKIILQKRNSGRPSAHQAEHAPRVGGVFSGSPGSIPACGPWLCTIPMLSSLFPCYSPAAL